MDALDYIIARNEMYGIKPGKGFDNMSAREIHDLGRAMRAVLERERANPLNAVRDAEEYLKDKNAWRRKQNWYR